MNSTKITVRIHDREDRSYDSRNNSIGDTREVIHRLTRGGL